MYFNKIWESFTMHRIKLTITCKIFDTTSISRWNDHLSYKHIPRTNVLKSEKVVFPNFDRNAWVVAGFFCGFLSWFELMWVWVDLIQSCLPFPSGSTVNKWQRCFAAIDHFPSFSSRLKFYRVICRVKNRWIYFANSRAPSRLVCTYSMHGMCWRYYF